MILKEAKLKKYFNILIFADNENNINDIVKRLIHNKNYLKKLNTAKNNWLEVPIDDVAKNVLDFLKLCILLKYRKMYDFKKCVNKNIEKFFQKSIYKSEKKYYYNVNLFLIAIK